MKSLAIIFFSLISVINFTFSTDQIHDILIVGRDTICLKSFPLEELGFTLRPFKYGNYDFPSTACWRGYQATWKVIGKKLFLVEIVKVDAPQERLDIGKYFAENDYSPTIIDGLIFADWFSMDLRSFPRDYKYLGCIWKSYRIKKCKSSIRFENGIMVYNKYKGR